MTKAQLILVAIALLIMLVGVKQAMSYRRSEWRGLSESEARAKLDAKLPSRIAEDKRGAISDKFVAKMRDRGVISEEIDLRDEPAAWSDRFLEFVDGN